MQETQEMQVLSLSQEDPLEYGNPLPYSCLENSTDRGARQATIHGVTERQSQISNETETTKVCGINWNGNSLFLVYFLNQKKQQKNITYTHLPNHLLCANSELGTVEMVMTS